MISVNLAIVNLLPFPGLDGWQLLVLIIEATARKKIPDKVKNLVSIIGLALLFGFMAVVLVLDLIKYVF
jgi:regulator of sigma E protease